MKAKKIGLEIKTHEWKNSYGNDRSRHSLYEIYKDEDGNYYRRHVDNLDKKEEDSEDYEDWTKGICTS